MKRSYCSRSEATRTIKIKNFSLYSKNKAFTLIELLTVVAIIGILATIVMINLKAAQAKSRDARRAQDLDTMNTAIVQYYQEMKSYPLVASGCTAIGNNNWCSDSSTVNSLKIDPYIAGYDPRFIGGADATFQQYLPTEPVDPGPFSKFPAGNLGNQRGYLYHSTGTDYKILSNYPENGSDPRYTSIVDPNRSPSGSAWSYCSPVGCTTF
jgi:prepilin-type N-terminal cleavage/methylation domain-containing protein